MRISAQGRTLDYAAGIYDYLSPVMTLFQERRLSQEVIRLVELEGGGRVLDVGCGTGALTLAIAARLRQNTNALVFGIDAAPKMIARAKKKAKGAPDVSFEVAAAQHLPYKDEFFDTVVSTFFFHHISFELKKKALNEVYRVLKKKGAALILDVDIPTNIFGALCAWCGYLLFWQEEIRENIIGKLREALGNSQFCSWYQLSHHLGYISLFKLTK